MRRRNVSALCAAVPQATYGALWRALDFKAPKSAEWSSRCEVHEGKEGPCCVRGGGDEEWNVKGEVAGVQLANFGCARWNARLRGSLVTQTLLLAKSRKGG